MASVTIPTHYPRQTVMAAWFNLIKSVISNDLLPRSASGIVTDGAGSLGASSLRFLRAYIASGYWSCGDVKVHHSYNGACAPGQGWMLCDGRQVTQANYDTEHGSGSWATYIGSSPMLNLYLPAMHFNVLPYGAATTTEDGISNPPARFGGWQMPLHNHQWYKHTANALVDDQTYDSSGSLILAESVSSATASEVCVRQTGVGTDITPFGADEYLESKSPVQAMPDSIETLYYMRII